jgi:hypothetical protein
MFQVVKQLHHKLRLLVQTVFGYGDYTPAAALVLRVSQRCEVTSGDRRKHRYINTLFPSKATKHVS